MEMYDEDKSDDDNAQELSLGDKFSKLLCKLEECANGNTKQIIEEMDECINEMDQDDFYSIFTEELFDAINEMIEEKKLSMENAIYLLKLLGYDYAIKNVWFNHFERSLLNERFEKMIVEEEKKKIDEKNEKLQIDLCECCLLLHVKPSSKLMSICASCLLKVALKKEKGENTQKEVEMALLGLSYLRYDDVGEKLYLNEIKEIIQYHQEHRNLTRHAYQSIWGFLIYRSLKDESLEEVVVNDLLFVKEATREIEELSQCVDWKRKEEEERKKETEVKEVLIIRKWIDLIDSFLSAYKLENEVNTVLIGSIVGVLREAKGHHIEICKQCIYLFEAVVRNEAVTVDDMLKRESVEAVLEGIQQPVFNNEIAYCSLMFFIAISGLLKRKKKVKMEEAKRKTTKRKVFEKIEEEGYEDVITSFFKIIKFLNSKNYNELSLNISDYFVNV